MSREAEIILVRHGESVRNLSCDLAREDQPAELERQMREDQDEAAWPLTEVGLHQADLAGTWIREHLGSAFEVAYTSPFVRAVQTARHLGLGLDYKLDERIRERDWGDYCAPGFPTYTVQNYLADLAVCADLRWKTPFPGGESIMDMVPRIKAFVDDLLRPLSSGRALVVTHGGTIRAFQVVLERLAPDAQTCPDRRLSNCCVIMYRLRDIDLDRDTWHGEVRTAHPALPGAPETSWSPVDRSYP